MPDSMGSRGNPDYQLLNSDLQLDDNATNRSSKNEAVVPSGNSASGTPIYDDVALDYQLRDSGHDSSLSADAPGLENCNEQSLLLPKPATAAQDKKTRWKSSLRRLVLWNNLLLLVLVFAALAVFGTRYALCRAQAAFNDISEFTIRGLELNEINNSGVVVSLDSELVFDYDGIENRFAKAFYSRVSNFVADITVKSIDNVEVFMAIEGYNSNSPEGSRASDPATEQENVLHKISTFRVLDPIDINLKSNRSSQKQCSHSPISISKQEVIINEKSSSALLNELFFIYNKVDFALENVDFKLRVRATGCKLKAAGGLYKSNNFALNIEKRISFDIGELKKLIGQPVENKTNGLAFELSNIQTGYIGDYQRGTGNKDLILIDNDQFYLVLKEFLITNGSYNELLVNADLDFKFKTKSFPVQNLVLNQIKWQLFIHDCEHQKLLKIANLISGKIDLVDREDKGFKTQMSISQLSQDLVKPCNRDSSHPSSSGSVLNRLFQDISTPYEPSQAVMVFAKAESSNNPFWLNYIMSSLYFPLNINFIKFYLQDYKKADISSYLLSTNITGLNVYLPKQQSNHDIGPLLTSGRVDLHLRLPPFFNDIDFNVDKIYGSLDLWHNGSKLLTVDMPEYQMMDWKFDHLLRVLTVNTKLFDDKVAFLDPTTANAVLQKLLTANDLIELNVQPNITGLIQNLNLFENGADTELEFENIPASFNYNFIPQFAVDDLMKELALEIENLVYLSSTIDSIVFVLNLRLFTPEFLYQKLSFSNQNNMIDLTFGYNSTLLGHALVKDLNFNASEFYSNVSILVGLDPFSFIENREHNMEDERMIVHAKVKDMLSKFLSNENPRVGIFGHNESFPAFKNISKAIDGISIEIQLPEYNCPVHSDGPSSPFPGKERLLLPSLETNLAQSSEILAESQNKIDKGASSSSWLDFWNIFHKTRDSSSHGFILGVTMHIMTSEVEFEVYNPILNAFVEINVISGKAIYKTEDGEEIDLAHVKKNTYLKIPPGVYKTPRLPIIYETGAATDILRKALNRNLDIESKASFDVKVGDFTMDLDYRGSGVVANVRL